MDSFHQFKRSNSKKAFTLVELVIVIAILAILAAIAIPVITTTVNSSKMSTMMSNSTTMEMLIKEAINNSKAEIDAVKYNGKTVNTATVEDVMIQNNIDLSVMNVQHIGGKEYCISWSNLLQGTVIISGEHITSYNTSTTICTMGED